MFVARSLPVAKIVKTCWKFSSGGFCETRSIVLGFELSSCQKICSRILFGDFLYFTIRFSQAYRDFPSLLGLRFINHGKLNSDEPSAFFKLLTFVCDSSQKIKQRHLFYFISTSNRAVKRNSLSLSFTRWILQN